MTEKQTFLVGDLVQYAGETFLVEHVWPDGHLGVTLRNGVYCELDPAEVSTMIRERKDG